MDGLVDGRTTGSQAWRRFWTTRVPSISGQPCLPCPHTLNDPTRVSTLSQDHSGFLPKSSHATTHLELVSHSRRSEKNHGLGKTASWTSTYVAFCGVSGTVGFLCNASISWTQGTAVAFIESSNSINEWIYEERSLKNKQKGKDRWTFIEN